MHRPALHSVLSVGTVRWQLPALLLVVAAGLSSCEGAPGPGVVPGGAGASSPSTGGSSLGGTSSGGAAQTTGGTASGGAPSSGGAGGNSGGSTGSGGATASAGGGGLGGLTSGGSASGGTSTTSGGSGGGGAGTGGNANTGGASVSGGSAGIGGGSTGGGSTGGGSGGSDVTCPMPTLKAGDSNQTLQVGSASRSYILHVPAKYDGTKPVPLVVDFHPLMGSGSSQRSGSTYPAQTDPDGVITVYPNGQSGPSGGAWNVGPCCVANVDDVAFAKALVAQVQKTACIDPKRVYAVGFSMGGGMSHYVACHAADVFAAVAPAAFDLLEENVADCKPARPLTVVSFRGTSDPVVPYAGGYSAVVRGMPITFLGAKATFTKWAEINQCTGSPSAEDGQGCSTYSKCQGGTQVTLCTKQGGGHDQGNASIAWPILKQYSLP